MYNLNLDYYSVKQENNETDPFAPDSWSSNSRSALNDVVDPNTEFKITPTSAAPVSTLESYGISTDPKTKFGPDLTSDTSKVFVRKEKHAPTMPTSARGSVGSVQQTVRNPICISQEIPQVHGAKKTASVGRLSNGTHTTNGTSPRPKQTSSNNALAVSKRNQPSSITNTSVGKHDNGCDTLSLDGEATSASQLAWAFRNARDRAEVDSNTSRCSSRFDLESNFSERADTFSTLSGVSGYEEELFRIRRLLLLDTARSYQEKLLEDIDRKSSTSKEDLQLRIENQSLQPEGTLQEAANDAGLRYSSDWRIDYERSLSNKVNASVRLQEVHAEVEALRQAMSDKIMPRRDVDTELQSAADQAADGADLAAANERLRVALQELRLDAESKAGAIRGLKAKVAAQQADLAALTSRSRAAESRTASRRNDLEAARKSAAWYREQLHASRAASLRAESALMSARAAAVSANHAAERLADEAAAARALAEETRLRAVADKDGLVKKLEAIHAGMLEREAAILEQLRRENLLAEPAPVHSRARVAATDVEAQLGETRGRLDERENEAAQLRKANAELVGAVAGLQATLAEKASAESDLRERVRVLSLAHDETVAKQRRAEATAQRIATEKADLEVALATAAREKAEVDSAVGNLRDDFARIERQYQTMQDELAAKDTKRETADLEACEKKETVTDVSEIESCLRKVLSQLAETEAFGAALRDLAAESGRGNGLPETDVDADKIQGLRNVDGFADRLAEMERRWQCAEGCGLRSAVEDLLGRLAARSEESTNRKQGDVEEKATELATTSHTSTSPPGSPTELTRLRAEVSRLTQAETLAAETLDGVRVALGRSEAMAHVSRTTIQRLQRDLDVEQVAHENCKAECERLRAASEEIQTEFPPDWEIELASLRADKEALKAQVGELRDATQSTLQQNKLLRLRLDALSKPARADPLPPPPPRYDDGGTIAALMRTTAPALPLNEPLADLQGCLDSLKTEMATLQRQLVAKARGETAADDQPFDI